MTTLSDFTLPRLDGQAQPLADYAGRLVLAVNTASKCGFTPQYEGLERLWQTYRDRGLVVLGLPCNQFGGQEPGQSVEIAEFCEVNYGVSFPLFAKLDVNGRTESPFYTWLKQDFPGDIEWNFAKFLVGREGNVIARFAPGVTPDELEPEIRATL